MAKSKSPAPAAEETLIEKVSHKIGEITGAVVEKYNDLVHPGDKKRKAKAHPRPVSKKSAGKKTAVKKSADPKKAKKAALKKAVTEAAKKTAAKKTAKKAAKKK